VGAFDLPYDLITSAGKRDLYEHNLIAVLVIFNFVRLTKKYKFVSTNRNDLIAVEEDKREAMMGAVGILQRSLKVHSLHDRYPSLLDSTYSPHSLHSPRSPQSPLSARSAALSTTVTPVRHDFFDMLRVTDSQVKHLSFDRSIDRLID
jgi:hypothetical protein